MGQWVSGSWASNMTPDCHSAIQARKITVFGLEMSGNSQYNLISNSGVQLFILTLNS